MKALLDTCAIAELQRPRPDPGFLQFIAELPEKNAYVSAITVGEIVKGVQLLSPGKKRTALEQWLRTIENRYADRIIAVDLEAARIWGVLSANARKAGKQVGAIDGFIAATGLRHGLQVVTRNVRDFEATGAVVNNPWQDS